MNITMKRALEMLQAVSQLDGYQNGGPGLTPYKFSGQTRLQIASARRKLRTIAEDYNEARNSALMDISNGSGMIAPGDIAAQIEMAKRDNELLRARVDLELEPTISASQLNLDDNPIAPSTLDMLGPLIVP